MSLSAVLLRVTEFLGVPTFCFNFLFQLFDPANAYARKLAGEGNRDDGFSIRTLTAAYRNKFRNRMHVAIAKGVARMINTCGLPVSVCKKYRNVAINPP